MIKLLSLRSTTTKLDRAALLNFRLQLNLYPLHLIIRVVHSPLDHLHFPVIYSIKDVTILTRLVGAIQT